eukprot:UN07138
MFDSIVFLLEKIQNMTFLHQSTFPSRKRISHTYLNTETQIFLLDCNGVNGKDPKI